MNKNYHKLITTTLKQKLEVKQFNKITVAEICRDAKVSRQCFYYYFSDLNDCLLSMFLEEANISERRLGGKGFSTVRELVFMVYKYIYEHQNIFINISGGPQRIYLFEKVYSTLDANIKRFLPKWIPESELLPQADINYIVNFYISNFISSLVMWMDKGFSTTPDFEVVHFTLVTEGMVKLWVQRFIQFNKHKALPDWTAARSEQRSGGDAPILEVK